MQSDMEKFQADFLESVRQMKRGEAARVTTVTNEQAVSALQWAYRLISKRELTP